MLRMTRSLATFILAGAIAPVAAHASLATILHIHPAASQSKGAKVSFVLVNKSDVSRDVMVDGHTYTLTPHQPVQISAAPGSQVTESDAAHAKSATVLFTVDRMHKGATVYIN